MPLLEQSLGRALVEKDPAARPSAAESLAALRRCMPPGASVWASERSEAEGSCRSPGSGPCLAEERVDDGPAFRVHWPAP